MAIPSKSLGTVNNIHKAILPSAARTALVTGDDFPNPHWSGADFIINVSLDPAAASITFTIQGKDETSGEYYTILTSAAIAATGTTVLQVHPTVTAAANLATNQHLPNVFRVNVAVADADSITYSVGANMLI